MGVESSGNESAYRANSGDASCTRTPGKVCYGLIRVTAIDSRRWRGPTARRRQRIRRGRTVRKASFDFVEKNKRQDRVWFPETRLSEKRTSIGVTTRTSPTPLALQPPGPDIACGLLFAWGNFLSCSFCPYVTGHRPDAGLLFAYNTIVLFTCKLLVQFVRPKSEGRTWDRGGNGERGGRW